MKPLLKWQYERIIKELLLLQDHAADTSCPCETDNERCIRKHLMTIEAYAEETVPIEEDEHYTAELTRLAEEAMAHRQQEERVLCGEGEQPDLVDWCRNWRKVFEGYSLACENLRAD